MEEGCASGRGVAVPNTFAARREAQSIQVYDRRSSGASEASCTMVRILARVVISLFRARPEVYGRIIRTGSPPHQLIRHPDSQRHHGSTPRSIYPEGSKAAIGTLGCVDKLNAEKKLLTSFKNG